MVVATWNYRWLLETSADEWRDTSSIRESSKLSFSMENADVGREDPPSAILEDESVSRGVTS